MNRIGVLLQALIATCLVLGSCGKAIYDYEDDCTVTYLVKFRYDYNMKYADAFAHEVNTVSLYLLDEQGAVVWRGTESGEKLASEVYAMKVDVMPGTYDLLAWCGTSDKGSFVIPESNVGSGLTCILDRKRSEEGEAYVDEDIDRLFHGYVKDVVFEDYSDYGGTFTYTVPLVKNTNHLAIVLQHLSGEPVDKDKFTFSIVDNNGSMDWDNSLIDDEHIKYYAWHTAQGAAGINTVKAGEFSAAIAELTFPRLVKGQSPRLVVTSKETGDTIIDIPFIDYALLVKGHYNQGMDDQEYLDRQDEWQMAFLLDEGNRWISTSLYINSWKVVLQDTEL